MKNSKEVKKLPVYALRCRYRNGEYTYTSFVFTGKRDAIKQARKYWGVVAIDDYGTGKVVWERPNA